MSPRKASGDVDLSHTITSDDVLGKEVIDPDGSFLGIVEKLHLHPDQFEIFGITVDKGFLKKGLFIGKGYIERVTPHAVFLSIRPATSVKGMEVFDPKGRKVGTVQEVRLMGSKNRIRALVLRSGFMRRQIIIPAETIEIIGQSVFLNVSRESILKQQKSLEER